MKGHYYKIIWKWSKDTSTPINWVSAKPIRIFGYCIGWKVKIVKKGFEDDYFTKVKP